MTIKIKKFTILELWILIIFAVLLIISSIPHRESNMFWCYNDNFGFPMSFYSSGWYGVECNNPLPQFNYLGLIFNIIIWYIISILIIFLFNKIKGGLKNDTKKRKNNKHRR